MIPRRNKPTVKAGDGLAADFLRKNQAFVQRFVWRRSSCTLVNWPAGFSWRLHSPPPAAQASAAALVRPGNGSGLSAAAACNTAARINSGTPAVVAPAPVQAYSVPPAAVVPNGYATPLTSGLHCTRRCRGRDVRCEFALAVRDRGQRISPPDDALCACPAGIAAPLAGCRALRHHCHGFTSAPQNTV